MFLQSDIFLLYVAERAWIFDFANFVRIRVLGGLKNRLFLIVMPVIPDSFFVDVIDYMFENLLIVSFILLGLILAGGCIHLHLGQVLLWNVSIVVVYAHVFVFHF